MRPRSPKATIDEHSLHPLYSNRGGEGLRTMPVTRCIKDAGCRDKCNGAPLGGRKRLWVLGPVEVLGLPRSSKGMPRGAGTVRRTNRPFSSCCRCRACPLPARSLRQPCLPFPSALRLPCADGQTACITLPRGRGGGINRKLGYSKIKGLSKTLVATPLPCHPSTFQRESERKTRSAMALRHKL